MEKGEQFDHGADTPSEEAEAQVAEDLDQTSNVIEVGANVFKNGMGTVRSHRTGPIRIMPAELRPPRRFYHPDDDVA